MMRLSPLVLAFVAVVLPGLGLSGQATATDQVPTLNVVPSCRGGSDNQASLESCLRSEEDARKQLVAAWSQYSAAQRRACVAEAGGELASYVELLTCLQIDKELKTLPTPNLQFGPPQKID